MSQTNNNHQNVSTTSVSLQRAIEESRKANVRSTIIIGSQFAEEKKPYEKDNKVSEWREWVEREYSCKPGRACQLIEIGKNLGPHLDTPEFEALPPLPDHPFKLYWLSKLRLAEIKEVLEKMNCLTCPPKEVMNEVLRRRDHSTVLNAWDKFKATVESNAASIPEGVREQLMEELAERFEEVIELIDQAPEPEADEEQEPEDVEAEEGDVEAA